MGAVEQTPAWTLIGAALTRKNVSYRDVERLSGGRIAKGTLGQYKNDEIKTLTPRAVVALSEVLDIPLDDLVDAVLRTIGIQPRAIPTLEDMVRRDDTIAEIGKRQILSLIQRHRATTDEVDEVLDRAAYAPDYPMEADQPPEQRGDTQ